MIRNKTFFNIISFVLLIVLGYICFSYPLLDTNLSRIANTNITMYIILILYSLVFGLYEFIILKKFNYKYKSYIGLISMLIGVIYPYNYQDVSSLNTNIHLMLGFASIVLISLCIVLCIRKLKQINLKLSNRLLIIYFIMMCINLYLYSKYMFINSLGELLFLGTIIIEETIIYNVL